MGLAAPRKRSKISHDPNNNLWSRSTTRFGERILHNQGWTPGSYLGAIDAPHAALHTEANASCIRVTEKDDTLGLGAKRGSQATDGPPIGLDSFQNLLGRLNGKSEVKLQSEQHCRDGLRRREYVSQRWGALQFVSAGFLEGRDSAAPEPPAFHVQPSDRTIAPQAEGMDCGRVPTEPAHAHAHHAEREEAKSGQQLKLERKQEKKRTRAERDRRREAKRMKREKETRITEGEAQSEPPSNVLEASSVNQEQEPRSSRHTGVRQRYIRQKKMAMMDCKALNEILMLRA